MKISQRHLFIATALCLLIVALAATSQRRPEPVYQGRPLSAWLEDLMKGRDGAEHDQAEEAVRVIGTNALPQLCMLLADEDSRAERWWRRLVRLVPGLTYRGHWAGESHEKALRGFIALGPAAKPAIPKLQELFRTTSRKDVAELLLALSPEGENSLSYFHRPGISR